MTAESPSLAEQYETYIAGCLAFVTLLRDKAAFQECGEPASPMQEGEARDFLQATLRELEHVRTKNHQAPDTISKATRNLQAGMMHLQEEVLRFTDHYMGVLGAFNRLSDMAEAILLEACIVVRDPSLAEEIGAIFTLPTTAPR